MGVLPYVRVEVCSPLHPLSPMPEWVNDPERNGYGEGCPSVWPRPRAGEDATDVLVPLQLNKYYIDYVLDSYDLDVEEQLNPSSDFIRCT